MGYSGTILFSGHHILRIRYIFLKLRLEVLFGYVTTEIMFGTKREQDGSWRKLHNDELHNLYFSSIIVRMIKSRRMRLAGRVARMGEGEVFTGFWLGGPKGRDHWEDLGVGGRITLSWTLGRKGSMGRIGFGWLRIESNGRLLWARWWNFGFRK
jgi:hypothetical protein